MNPDLEAKLENLIAKDEIREVLYRYCRGVDRLDHDLIASTFHENAVDDHGYFQVSGPAIADVIIEKTKEHSYASQHLIGNTLIDVIADVAVSESYLLALLEISIGGKPHTRVRCGRYIDRLERRNGKWKIAHRTVVDEWDRVDPVADRISGREMFQRGIRSRDDLIYRLTEETLHHRSS